MESFRNFVVATSNLSICPGGTRIPFTPSPNNLDIQQYHRQRLPDHKKPLLLRLWNTLTIGARKTNQCGAPQRRRHVTVPTQLHRDFFHSNSWSTVTAAGLFRYATNWGEFTILPAGSGVLFLKSVPDRRHEEPPFDRFLRRRTTQNIYTAPLTSQNVWRHRKSI